MEINLIVYYKHEGKNVSTLPKNKFHEKQQQVYKYD